MVKENKTGLEKDVALDGVRGRLMYTVNNFCTEISAQVRVDGSMTEWLEKYVEVHQACEVIPKIPIVFMKVVKRNIRGTMGERKGQSYCHSSMRKLLQLLYVEDVGLLSH